MKRWEREVNKKFFSKKLRNFNFSQMFRIKRIREPTVNERTLIPDIRDIEKDVSNLIDIMTRVHSFIGNGAVFRIGERVIDLDLVETRIDLANINYLCSSLRTKIKETEEIVLPVRFYIKQVEDDVDLFEKTQSKQPEPLPIQTKKSKNEEQGQNCLHKDCPDRIPREHWKCPGCGSKPKKDKFGKEQYQPLDGGSMSCLNKKCNIGDFHWCALVHGYVVRVSPIHH